MKSSTDWHSEWLISAASAEGCRHGCRDYHLLAPTLHALGYFQSYERYGPEIRGAYDIVAETKSGTLRLLVLGAESEESLAALMAQLAPRDCRIDVLDRCATPLSRIAAACEAGDSEIRTIRCDIFDFVSDGELYDVVVADSFFKQIAPGQRVAAVQRIAAALRPGGIALIREYIGVHVDLLANFWTQLETLLRKARWRERASAAAQRILQDRFPALQAYMVTSGGAYECTSAMTDDLRAGGLALIQERSSNVGPYTIALFRRVP